MLVIPGPVVNRIFNQAGLQQGCIKLQFEASPERGGDSLSLQSQAQSAGDKLSPPPGRGA